MKSKTTRIMLLYLFFGLVLFNISFVYNISSNAIYKNYVIATSIKDMLLTNSNKIKTTTDLDKFLRKHYDHRYEYVILIDHQNKVLYTNTKSNITSQLVNAVINDKHTCILYTLIYVPSSYKTFSDYEIKIKLKSDKNQYSKRYRVVVGTPTTDILCNPVLLTMDIYFVIFILFIFYANYYVRNYEKH